jgi:hypothetical protein
VIVEETAILEALQIADDGSEEDRVSFGRRLWLMTPDWAAKPTAVPYAVFNNPQSLNLYAYVLNNPLAKADSDGHCCDWLKNVLAGAAKGLMNLTLPATNTLNATTNFLRPTHAPLPTNLPSSIPYSNATQAVSGVVAQGTVQMALAAAGVPSEGSVAGTAARGISAAGGIMSSEVNAAGGTVYTSTGAISQDVVGTAVNNAMTAGAGEINILSGVHGAADGTMTPAPEFFQADQAAFGNLPGVTVQDMTTLSPAQVDNMVNGPGTTIGAFCNSGACLNSPK